MNSIIEQWIQTCRRELLGRTLIWNQRPLLHALREFATFYNGHRPHRTLKQAAPLRPPPEPINVPAHTRQTPGSSSTRPARRNPPRVPTYRLTRPDD
ncbi:integrase core domain-containing protein [Streptomyces antnestii]|uniref:integrase core domain-containing protein n=1 Tax=Streptomyces antnestii TaxID=2494256 RepID=UPI001CB93891|nr:integrase core domain-containing protein [Streptomyces sp. San01]